MVVECRGSNVSHVEVASGEQASGPRDEWSCAAAHSPRAECAEVTSHERDTRHETRDQVVALWLGGE
jgi:hypothetical protein